MNVEVGDIFRSETLWFIVIKIKGFHALCDVVYQDRKLVCSEEHINALKAMHKLSSLEKELF